MTGELSKIMYRVIDQSMCDGSLRLSLYCCHSDTSLPWQPGIILGFSSN